MNTLIINTANESLEIVLACLGKVFSHSIISQARHNETMLQEIDNILNEHNLRIEDIGEYGVVIGPGSFTGIRVGVATIKAFRDYFNVLAKGINNLDYLFNLAHSQNEQCNTVAILGSRNSYFVATMVLGQLYKYERNLTEDELLSVANGGAIGMFKAQPGLNCFEVKLDSEILLKCFETATDETLTPVYYQLSQAESEKIKHANLEICDAEVQDLIEISKLEQSTNLPNKMTNDDFEKSISNPNHSLFVAKLDGKVVGFVSTEITDEVNIENVVVEKVYRNYGIGTKLLDKVADFAKSKGNKTLSLEVSDKNITAYLLYAKYGFALRRIRKNYYKDNSNALEMIKTI